MRSRNGGQSAAGFAANGKPKTRSATWFQTIHTSANAFSPSTHASRAAEGADARTGRGAVAPAALRWTILALLAVTGVNYLATGTVTSELAVGDPVWLAITLMNPAALLAAWVLHLRVAWRAPVG